MKYQSENEETCDTPIRVLEVIRQGQIGGGESHLIDLILGFNREQILPIVLSFTSGQMIDLLRANGIICYVIETIHPFDLKIIRSISALIRQQKIDLIHAHGSRAASNVVFIAKYFKIHHIYTVHGWSFHKEQSKTIYMLRALSEKIICNQSRHVICVSEDNYQTGRKCFGLKKAEVIPNGVNLHRFKFNGTFHDVKKELKIPSTDFLVGFIGRITIQKDPMTFIESIRCAHAKNPHIKGLIIGEGDMEYEMLKYIKQKALSEMFYLSTFRTDIPDVLNCINVFCLPSLWEGLSIALLEAMAMRKAIVVTPTDGTREVIADNVNGKIVPFSSPKALADKYQEYYDNPIQVEEYGRRAHNFISKAHNCDRVSSQVAAIYKSVVASKSNLE